MQILSPSGETIAASENAAEITPAMLEALKREQRFSATEDITMHLHPVLGGYMIWQTELSQINQALRELQRPVSYTHLDVYKRQMFNRQILSESA